MVRAMKPVIRALATAVPPHAIGQAEVRDHIAASMPGGMPDRIARIYDSTGIETRYLVQPSDAYLEGQDWEQRNQVYLDGGQRLLERVAADALAKAGREPGEIDCIVCVSSTGIATPSIPTQMLKPMGFNPVTPILPLFGYGCAGGVLGLQVARDMVLAAPERRVLLLTLELCSLAFRLGEISKKAIVASTLFADGASAAVVEGRGDGPALGAFAQHSWPDTRSMMGWDVDALGLGLILSRDIPSFVRKEFAPVLDRFIAAQGLDLTALDEPACHPGGRKVIEALEAYFEERAGRPVALNHTREILRGHGNMSSPTVHFVLERILADGGSGPLLMTALGPGFTGAMGVIER